MEYQQEFNDLEKCFSALSLAPKFESLVIENFSPGFVKVLISKIIKLIKEDEFYLVGGEKHDDFDRQDLALKATACMLVDKLDKQIARPKVYKGELFLDELIHWLSDIVEFLTTFAENK